MKILVTDMTPLGAMDLPEGVLALPFDERRRVPEQHRDAEALVVWGQNPDLESFFADLPHLRWVQTLQAGPDRIMAAGLPEDVIITNGVHFHDVTVAEHALALALANLRRLPECLEAQHEHRWASELGGIQPLRPKGRVTTLWESNVVVWGFGAIGQTIAQRFSAVGAHVTGIAHTSGKRAGFTVLAVGDADEALRGADVLVMVLPTRPDTHHILDARVLDLLPDHAQVVNVGRGSTVDEGALAAALSEGRLGAAALDVAEVEPLPADSPLWDAPRILITPHGAGGRPVGVEERVSHNVRALLGLGGEMIGVMPR
ncbi:MAG: D-2-hydroxyacid dehydrogenase [Propionibacterium sp.]|nr:D-2-hydroxyacid dehydrogenase [Propionibacterium sp.]